MALAVSGGTYFPGSTEEFGAACALRGSESILVQRSICRAAGGVLPSVLQRWCSGCSAPCSCVSVAAHCGRGSEGDVVNEMGVGKYVESTGTLVCTRGHFRQM